jgi:hypothetical protein
LFLGDRDKYHCSSLQSSSGISWWGKEFKTLGHVQVWKDSFHSPPLVALEGAEASEATSVIVDTPFSGFPAHWGCSKPSKGPFVGAVGWGTEAHDPRHLCRGSSGKQGPQLLCSSHLHRRVGLSLQEPILLLGKQRQGGNETHRRQHLCPGAALPPAGEMASLGGILGSPSQREVPPSHPLFLLLNLSPTWHQVVTGVSFAQWEDLRGHPQCPLEAPEIQSIRENNGTHRVLPHHLSCQGWRTSQLIYL